MVKNPFFPIPPDLLARVSQTITGRVSRLPFERCGVRITPELAGVAVEYLNAEPAGTLPVTTPRDAPGESADGLDRLLEERLQVAGKTTAPVIAGVLVEAGIAETVRILDRPMRCQRSAVRLLDPWRWHIASRTPSWEESAAGRVPGVSWTNVCAVCRSGSLDRVEGKQLFGVPHTDFFLECSSCGAKFIPVGPAYRLVSIRSIRDPLWKKHLDKTHSGEEWAAIARGTSPKGNPLLRSAEAPSFRPADERVPAISLTVLKDGSLAVPVTEKVLYFRPAPVRFFGSVRGEPYTRMEVTLAELISDPAFSHLRDRVNQKYAGYLPLKAGVFMQHLKERHDPFYTEFLNQYGDEKYGTFRAGDAPGIDRPGVLLVVVNRSIYHASECPVSVEQVINGTFGRVAPGHCFLNGGEVRCRINAVLCTNKDKAGLYFYACGDPAERQRILSSLSVHDPPKKH